MNEIKTFSLNLRVPVHTLAQLGTNCNCDHNTDTKSISSLTKRARAKTFTAPLSVKLASLDSGLKKSYWNTYHCNESLVQNGKTVTGSYCGNRWCSVCNRIRTAKLIHGYTRPLAELKEKQFVTLTLPNCEASELRKTIDLMLKYSKEIQETFKKRHLRGVQDWQLIGLRKLECTYNRHMNTYHPHFHFVVQGKTAAIELKNEWLKRVPTATDAAQDIRDALAGSEMELFKYFTKITTKTDEGFKTFVKPLDVIFTAMRGLRVFQPIGIKKDVSEEIEDIISEEIEDIKPDVTVFQWFKNDWINTETGEVLTGYVPSEAILKLIDNIKTNGSS